VAVPGLFRDYLSGAEVKLGVSKIRALIETNKEEGGAKPIKYLILELKGKGLAGGVLARKGKEESLVAELGVERKGFKAFFLREFLKGKEQWGAFAEFKEELKEGEFKASYRLHSKGFTSFGLKEYFFNEGFIYRPGEGDLRLLKVSGKRQFKTGLKRVDRLLPSFSLFYLKLSTFKGSYIGEEGGVILSLKPGRRCQLSLIGSLGNGSSYYEGVAFRVSW